jgi:hypothetical protein
MALGFDAISSTAISGESAQGAATRAPLQAPTWLPSFLAAAIAPNLLCGVLGAVALLPFNNNATALPVAPAPFSTGIQVQGTPLPLLAPAVAAPFVNADWPLPRVAPPPPRGDAQSIPLALFAGAQGEPFGQFDWPLPKGAPRLEQTWSQNLLATTLAQSYQLREPLDAPQFSAARPILTDPPNLLLTLLAPASAAPFNNPDSTLPRGWSVDRTAGGFAATIYLGPNAPPLSLYDWPLPKAPPRLEQTWSQNLLATTLGPAPPAPFANADWPLSRVAPPPPRGEGQSIPLALFAGAQGEPFGQFDWPLPKAPPRLEQSWSQNLLATTLALTPRPFLQTDWPLPARSAPIRGDAAAVPLTIFAGIQGEPLGQIDWPLPKAPPRLEQTWSQNLLATTLAPAAPAPFVNGLQPIAITVQTVDRRWSQNLLASTLALPPVGAVTPDGPRMLARGAIGDAQGSPLALLGSAAPVPFSSPVTALFTAPWLDRSSPNNLLASTLAPTALPPGAPSPLGPRFLPRASVGEGQSIPLPIFAGIQGKPFFNPDTSPPRTWVRLEQTSVNTVVLATLPVTVVPGQLITLQANDRFFSVSDGQDRRYRLVLNDRWFRLVRGD